MKNDTDSFTCNYIYYKCNLFHILYLRFKYVIVTITAEVWHCWQCITFYWRMARSIYEAVYLYFVAKKYCANKLYTTFNKTYNMHILRVQGIIFNSMAHRNRLNWFWGTSVIHILNSKYYWILVWSQCSSIYYTSILYIYE